MKTKKKTTQTSEKNESQSPTRRAFLAIRRMFAIGEIGPGQKIEYRELAKQLGMSSTPIIQAMYQLELQGLVRHVPKRGYYSGSLSAREVEEVYELRELIEVSLLPKTMKLLDNKGIKQLKAALDGESQAAKTIYLRDRLIKSMDFHFTLASLSGCHVQQRVLKELFDLTLLKYQNALLTLAPIDYEYSHESIFNALVNRDLGKAQKFLSGHVSEVKEYFVKALSRKME